MKYLLIGLGVLFLLFMIGFLISLAMVIMHP